VSDTPQYTPRPYADIVRDLLTTLTGGTVRETAVAPVDGPVRLDRLASRPVRRVSHLEGVTPVAGTNVAVRFTDADFALADTDGDGEADAIVFRDNGRKPTPGSTLTVNYYPVQVARPVPLTDLNVGSVVRTLLETVAREHALAEQYLQRIYESAFVETAEGTSLDRVVALIGVTRLPAGHPLVTVRFSRNAATGGKITLPPGTVVTDAAANRYATVTALTLEAGEESRSVLAAGVTADTGLVEAGALDRPETLVAGISAVTNPEPAFRQAAGESDEALRRRARGALHGAVRGTLDALRFGVLSVSGVRAVEIQEFPNGVPGEVRIDVAYDHPDDAQARAAVAARIDELRPAGIRVLAGSAARTTVAVQVDLVLTGRGVSGAELADVTAGVEERVAARLNALAPGATVRLTALTAAALEDARVADAAITFRDAGGAVIETLSLARGEVLDVQRPFTFPTPSAEEAGAAVATVADVDLTVPVHLEPGVTVAEATAALTLAVDAHLAGRTATAPLTVDGLAAAVRDDTRYALVRELTTVTVEHQGRFTQLLDGQGAYQPGPAEQLRRRALDVSEDGT
jgi:uncharacterized phage protein gp47/JayE